jgi:hypothetical protein
VEEELPEGIIPGGWSQRGEGGAETLVGEKVGGGAPSSETTVKEGP